MLSQTGRDPRLAAPILILLFNESKAPSVSTWNQIQTFCCCSCGGGLGKSANANCHLQSDLVCHRLFINATLLRRVPRRNGPADVVRLSCHLLTIRRARKRAAGNKRSWIWQELSMSPPDLTSLCLQLFIPRWPNPKPRPDGTVRAVASGPHQSYAGQDRPHQPVSWHRFFFSLPLSL